VGFLSQVFHWFTTSANWTGSGGIPELFWQSAKLSAAVVVTAVVVGGSLGALAGHTGRGSIAAVNAANAARAIPTLALLTLLAIVPSISIRWGGFLASYLALVVLAVPPILTNTFVGMREVDADVRDAAKAMGLTGWQVFGQVELPLALPFVAAGIRTASIEVVATSTLAAYVSYSDLGTYVITGLNAHLDVEAFAGSVLVAVLAAMAAWGLRAAQWLVTPPPLRRISR
jgi:osmoprotectant transport system permease protein